MELVTNPLFVHKLIEAIVIYECCRLVTWFFLRVIERSKARFYQLHHYELHDIVKGRRHKHNGPIIVNEFL